MLLAILHYSVDLIMTMELHIITNLKRIAGSGTLNTGKYSSVDKSGQFWTISLPERLFPKVKKGNFIAITDTNKNVERRIISASQSSAIFQIQRFDIDQSTIDKYLNPDNITVAASLGSPNKKIVSVTGIVKHIYEERKGENWRRKDIVISDEAELDAPSTSTEESQATQITFKVSENILHHV